MAEKDQDAALREAAKARGLRLVKSRRRKPGGDFGRYGLIGLDSGRQCLGFGAEGLTASAEEVHAYLRGGEVASWKRSLIGVVGVGGARKKAKVETPARPELSRGTPQKGKEERTTPSPSAKPRRGVRAERPAPPDSPPAFAGGSTKRPALSGGQGSLVDGGGTSSSSSPKSPRRLAVREATRRDAAALAKLTQIPAATLAERLAAAIKAGEPPLMAARGETPVGVAAWTILPTLDHGPRGRITLLLVADAERRQGVGTALLEAAEQHLADAGVTTIELLLDIDFEAPTAFLRRTGWERRTNGYARTIV